MPFTGASGRRESRPSDSAIRAQLDRILASAVFLRSQQLRRFLTFTVDQTLAGQAQTLKESVLAHELYGKGTDFDGGTDPVVRVDARRLRDKLREYDEEGRHDPVVISLPKGSYVPVFEANSAGAAVSAHPVGDATLQWKPAFLSRETMVVGAFVLVAVAATAAIAWRALRTEDASAELHPLASYPGAEGAPALSPNGDLVAFAWSGQEPGPADIYVKAVGGEALRRLTDTPGSESNPAWSPNGQSIAFVLDGAGVFTISQLGGAERQVSPSGNQVAWAGDSKSVLIRDRDGNSGPFSIYQVFLDTLERRRLTQPIGNAGDWRFEVSPDAESLALIRYVRVGIGDLYVVPMRGGEPRRLTNWNTALGGLSWTPDGREIVYSVEEPPVGRLWRIPANLARPGRGLPVANIPVGAANPSISRPMPGMPARLAFQTITRDVDLQLMNIGTPTATDTIAAKPFSNSSRVEGSARFSPDGERIAFISYRSGTAEVWVAGRDGSGLRQVTSLEGSDTILGGWSPDSSTIAFEATIDGNTDVYLIGADGGHLLRLTEEPSIDGVPSWSGDGRSIYFSSARAGAAPNIWRISPSRSEAIQITREVGFEPKESPDGRFLFYLDGYPGGAAGSVIARVMRVPVAGGEKEVVVEGVRPFLWAVTDEGIVFVTREAGFDAIDLYRFSDRRVARVGRLAFRISGSYSQMTVSRDGRWALATQMVRFDADLMQLENFR